MQTYTITAPNPNATLLVAAGSGPTLISNSDTTNTLYLGDTPASSPQTDITETVPLAPTQFVVVDGTKDVYGSCLPGFTALTYIVPGGMSFFQRLTRLIIQGGTPGSGLFIYSGVPSVTDLILSIAAVAGIDPQGIDYPAGLTIGEISGVQVNLDQTGLGGTITWILNNAAFANPYIFAETDSPTLSSWVLQGPQNLTSGHTDNIQVDIFSGDSSLNTSAQLSIFYISASAFETAYLFLGWQGCAITGPVTGIEIGTGLSATNPAVLESWHAISLTGGPPGVTGYARVKRLAESNFILLDIQISFTVLAANTTFTIGAMPSAAYYPTVARNVAAAPGGTVTNANTARVFIPLASGGIQLVLPVGESSLGCQGMVALD